MAAQGHWLTLIELLVVISIIALLMAILVPALSKAKDLAKSAVCLSNVKQQAISNFMYVNDHGRFAQSATIGSDPNPTPAKYYVFELLVPYGPA